ncbi:serine/threonine-protein phosphatase 6 regulatory ankyrin repeat subunit C-like [Copidosoma floridanum]|uniref:serine/threonine-protein phosphatase 6 regulatory ankyrin repeat subunit C-like n=1 Tax=Copidosoma floridanum TaxID=29053 RepID=UPI0006C93C85|nr:serine/threonine-protein phosphatase 6 regulatory ankyrin repeat subunit C-like [Copidosoma floridanum]
MSAKSNADDNLLKLAIFKKELVNYPVRSDIRNLLNKSDINYAVSLGNSGRSHCQNQWLGNTALHFVVETYSCNLKLLEFMLNLGADVTCKNNHGFTPLHLAYRKNSNKDVIDLLLAAQIKFNNNKNPTSKDNISHMHIACVMKNLEAVKFFLKSGAQINEAISNDSKLFPALTPLHLAIHNGDEKMAHLLLQRGADYNCVNARGMSPVHLLIETQIYFNSYTGSSNVRERRLRSNERIYNMILKSSEYAFRATDSIGLSQFHTYCTIIYNFEFEEWNKFLNSNVDINASLSSSSPVWPNYTPLHFAAHCNLKTVLLLLSSGANLMAKDAKGKTPLDICLETYSPLELSTIFKTQKDGIGAIKFQNGENLADVIAELDTESKLTTYLTNPNVYVNNAISNDSILWPGFTLLHLAVMLSPGMNRSKVCVCLRHNADITIRDANNMTAFHLAFRLGRKRCVLDILNFHHSFPANPVDSENLSHFHIICSAYNGATKKMVDKFMINDPSPNEAMPSSTSFKWTITLSSPVKHTVIPAGARPLHISAAIEHPQLAKLLLEHNADSNLLDAEGYTWLHRAFMNLKGSSLKEFASLFWLDDKSLESNHTAPGKLSHFHVACYAMNSRAVKALLPLQDNINEPISSEVMKHVKNPNICLGDTPLHLVIKHLDIYSTQYSEQIIDLLLTNGADVRVVNQKGLTPFHELLLKRNTGHELIERLALEFYKKKRWIDKTGLTQLHVACVLKDTSLIKKLLGKQEGINSQINSDSPLWPSTTPLDLLLRNEYPEVDEAVKLVLNRMIQCIEDSLEVNERCTRSAKYRKTELKAQCQCYFVNQDGLSAFHVSCMGKDPIIVEKFFKLGVDINEPKDYFASSDAGYTPLHFAIKYSSSQAVLELLLSHGANINLEDSNGYTSVYVAAVNKPENIKTISRYGTIDISSKNSFGYTILDLLLRCNEASNKSFLYLLKYGTGMENVELTVKINLVKKFVHTFDYLSCKSLFKFIPGLDAVDDSNRNFIHHFITNNTYDFNKIANNIELLIKHGCKLDHQDKSGKTPLHLAVISQLPDNIKTLLSVGADVNIKDKQGQTPYMLCFTKIKNEHHLSIICSAFHNHVLNLKILGLYIDPKNENCYERTVCAQKRMLIVLNQKYLRINCKRMSLRAYFTEVIQKFTLMPSHHQLAIYNFLEKNKRINLFSEWSILKTLLKRICERKVLFESAIDALHNLLDPRLAQHCLESILLNLPNQDLKNIIHAL